jgi:diguanylate cyclase (GGDEF)-like protein
MITCFLLDLTVLGGATFLLVNFVATAAMIIGVRLHRPRSRSAWLVLAASQASVFTANTAFVVSHAVGDTSFPGPADVLNLLPYPLTITALVILVRRRTPSWDGPTLIDAAVLATSAALLSWTYLLAPLTAGRGHSTLAQLVELAYPVMDVLLLAVALRLTLGAGTRTPAYYMLSGALALSLCGDTAYVMQRLYGTYTDPPWATYLYLVAGVLLGLSALHPSMTRVDTRSAVAAPDATPGRLLVLAVAALIAPGVLVVEYLRGALHNPLVIGAACAVLFLLVLARMTALVAVQRRMAITDGLTGLRTRRFLQATLEIETDRARRSGSPLGVILLDVDHFKSVNDGHGHQAGDRVLIELAQRVRAGCRSGNIVARYGGEEFAVLVPAADAEALASIADGIRRSIRDVPVTINHDGTALAVTASIGTAVFPADAATGEQAIRMADQALYAAKRTGRDRVVAAGSAIEAETGRFNGVPVRPDRSASPAGTVLP